MRDVSNNADSLSDRVRCAVSGHIVARSSYVALSQAVTMVLMFRGRRQDTGKVFTDPAHVVDGLTQDSGLMPFMWPVTAYMFCRVEQGHGDS
jgi:hypothetical protein